tara:strand:+ start:319 stop:555 length:237 start_codon:yes stop_codon:yes gene_type:complete
MKAIESFIITPANNKKVNGEFNIKSILLRYINEIIPPKIYNSPKINQESLLENLLVIFANSIKAKEKQIITIILKKIM